MLRLARVVIGVVASVALAGCGGDSTSPEEALASVDVQPRDAVLQVGTLWPHMHQTAHNRAGLEIKTRGEWTSSDPTTVEAELTTGAIAGIAIGAARVTDVVTVHGVTMSAFSDVSVVGSSPLGSVTATTSAIFTPQLVTVTRGGAAATVTWTFQAELHTVTWDAQPPGAAVADIPASSSTAVARDFTIPGEYEYHCAIHSGMTGSLLVQ